MKKVIAALLVITILAGVFFLVIKIHNNKKQNLINTNKINCIIKIDKNF